MVETLNIAVQETAKSRLSTVDFSNIIFGKNYADHMFSADYKDGEWHDLKIIPYGEISFEPSLASLHYGQAIFEGMKAYKDFTDGGINIFRPTENAARFNASAVRMCMPEIPEEIFVNALAQLVALDRNWVPDTWGSSLYIRPFMFATDEFVGVRPSQTYKFMVFCSPAGQYYTEAIKVKVETHYTRAAEGGTGFAKCAGNYGGALYPSLLAQKEGYHQLLWTDAAEHQYFEESGTMNAMFVINDVLLTPATSDSILKGITRKSVVALVKSWGMQVEERKVSIIEIMTAIENGSLKEVFGVGTAATIAPIAVIGYEGKDYVLPESRTVGNRILQELNDIKHGKQADTHGWNFKV
ncbi:MAG: branched-chain amino acid aminotransferase [Verrucomicrobia bacterium]|nr:branched-chain amino acid aminotransferase [Cytophagales bacterium]